MNVCTADTLPARYYIICIAGASLCGHDSLTGSDLNLLPVLFTLLEYIFFIRILQDMAFSARQEQPDDPLVMDQVTLMPAGVRKEIITNLQTLFEQEPLYLKPDIRSASLAAALEIPQNYLSEAVNKELGCTIPNLINQYRIDYVKQRLRNETRPSLLLIAYDAGFSSKTAFNRAFKKETQMSPTAWLRSVNVQTHTQN